ncbi:MAG: cytochrome c assembly protein [Saprospiraceae bacterium]|nr:MAG: cytochrome c assembly protein [Saprospiraceae bacterium]
MEEIQYIGEHLLPSYIGQFAVLFGFSMALLSAIAYFFATNRRDTPEAAGWQRIGRTAFLLHGLAFFSVIGLIFFVMTQQYYEYQYVQAHVSDDLPFKYIFSAFWEGQEGSFLLWMFWHIVLGVVLMLTAKKWEAPVLSTLSLIQVALASMLLGVYLGWGPDQLKIGSNPLLLLREVMDAPIFSNADYVGLIKGTGLNPLLQNYWMTIHPPTLFLGFASTAIPFCFAIAGLWTREHKAWLKPALPWALFSGTILGTGVLMGGAWAYEALSFGGYWAWDPVENMSLVPWLILVGGIHTNLIAKSTGYSIRSSYIFYLLTFIFIVYSTYLTRSGILGDTSVHAFTEMGLEAQLILFIAGFMGLSIYLLVSRYKGIPAPPKEEATSSKEFWMFIGSLVLLFSALIITASTSLPVYNKLVQLFDPTFEGRVITEPIPHYNKYQLWIGVFIGLLSGFSQYLRYKEINFDKRAKYFITHLTIAVAVAAALTGLASLWLNIYAWQYWLLLFAALFTVVANLDFILTFLKGNLKLAASAFAHIGFGVMIVGIIASGLNKRIISQNTFIMEGLIQDAEDESMKENILLFKNSPTMMQGYEVTYVRDTMDQHFTRAFQINYKQRDEAGNITQEFDLYPNILYDKSFTKVAAANPSTKRYLNKDIFTHIASLPQVEIDMDYRKQREDSLNYRSFGFGIGETIEFPDTIKNEQRNSVSIKKYRVKLLQLLHHPQHPDYEPEPGDYAIGARLQLQHTDEDSTFIVEPVVLLRGQFLYHYPVQINDLSTKIRINSSFLDQVFPLDKDLHFQEFLLKQGETFNYKGYSIHFTGFNRTPNHTSYKQEEGDIAVSAVLEVKGNDGQTYRAEPLYLIRDSRPLNVKDVIEELGLHFRFEQLDPVAETLRITVADNGNESFKLPVEIATNSLRSDYVVLKAIEFPGINYFWIGSLMMMLGLGMGMVFRIRQNQASRV